MKISAESSAFAQALSIVTKAASQKTTVPILSAVVIEAAGGVLTFRCTDNEMSITLRSAAKVEEDGTAAVPARMLGDIVSRLSECQITLSCSDGETTLRTDAASYTLRSYNNEEFPELPQFDSDRAFTVPSREFAKAISHASAAVSADETRPVLCGLLVSFSGADSSEPQGSGKGVTMASTDSYRLSLHRGTLGGGPAEDISAVIPARALSEVAQLANVANEVQIALTDNQALFKVKSVVITTRLIDGSFPEYGRLLPESFDKEFIVDAQQLRESLRRANLFSGAKSKSGSARGGSPGAPVRFSFHSEQGTLSGGRLTISSKSEDTGEAAETLDAEMPEGVEEFVVAFNGRYIAEGVSRVIAAGADSVRMRANEPLKPVVLDSAPEKRAKQSGDTAEEIYLLMPMRDPYSEHQEATNPSAATKK